jgi:pseudoazurin
MIERRQAILGAGAAALLAAVPALAKPRSHVVRMTGSPGGAMAFSPRILRVAAGDSVTFAPDAPGHNSQSTPGMIPEGATGWRGGIGKPLTVTFDVPGHYGYHCLPHRSLGMVGLVIVEGPGAADNLEAARAVTHPGKAQAAWDAIWAEALG